MAVYRQLATLRWTALLARIALLLAGLFALTTDAKSVTLAWDVDSDPSVVGYRLYYGISSGNYTQNTDVGNGTTVTITNLTVGYTYFFVVRAYNAFGLESPTSNVVFFNTSTGASGAVAKDFNGAGQAGLVWENTITGERHIWTLTNGAWTGVIWLPRTPTQWHIAGVGDFLGTGQAGLVWENTITGQHHIWTLKNGAWTGFIWLPRIPTQWHIENH